MLVGSVTFSGEAIRPLTLFVAPQPRICGSIAAETDAINLFASVLHHSYLLAPLNGDVCNVLILFYASDRRNLLAYFFFPIRVYKDDYRPANLPFIESGLRIGRDEFISTDDPVMDHVGTGGVFQTRPHDNGLAVLKPT